ncbi:MAG: flagellar assembly peptidoglycan hydrolase FlgJ [Halothiobacillaceae bacterium]|jgi:flagellar protein FlgJ|nr:flagellar assembly peptidoglycan hydrolase FlgJ [Halothiobacillaceae bacterium]MDY0050241.1 flagellar assembly peptidoglycan hydrolase FlgJ [Halothiobacillaceae bacterium]
MSLERVDSAVYTDVQGLGRLKAQAAKDPKGALKNVAQQFETQFIQMMLKSMRAASGGESLMDGKNALFFRDMYDQQTALEMARSGGIGLADALVTQMERAMPGLKSESATETALAGEGAQEGEAGVPMAYPVPERRMDLLPMRMGPFPPLSSAHREAGEGTGPTAGNRTDTVLRVASPQTVDRDAEPGAFEDASSFVEAVLPHARAAAARLGVKAEVLIAQSALETGWGQRVPRDTQGQPNYNLFGIKADRSWDGARTTVRTLEFEGGAMVRKTAAFRAYASIKESFDDYVCFLQDNPRYADALKHAGDARRFVNELQKAGYATDPDYANKILAIVDSDRLAVRRTGSAKL